MNADVGKAVASAELRGGPGEEWIQIGVDAWEVILGNAEKAASTIAELCAHLRDADERSALRSRERTEAVLRAEQAEALLRDIKAWDVGSFENRETIFALPLALRQRITAHLGAEQ